MYKIILNTMPRTAGYFFFDILREMFLHNERDYKNPRDAGEWSQTDNWVILCHEPLLFRAPLQDVTAITVLRNPIDAIASQILKTSYGFGNSTIAGRPEIVDGNMAFFRDQKEEFIRESMYQESRMWEGYTYGSMLAIDRIIPLTFEQVTDNLADILPKLYKAAGAVEPCKFLTQEDIDNHLIQRQKHAKNDVNEGSGAANAFPIEKPEEYKVIRDYVANFERMPKLMDDYNKALTAYAKRQKDLGI